MKFTGTALYGEPASVTPDRLGRQEGGVIREWGINMLLGAGMILGVVLVVAGAMCVVDAVSSVVAEVWTWAFGGHV